MSAEGEIIEIANPGWGVAGKVDSPLGAADTQAQVTQIAAAFGSRLSVTKDADVTDPEIVAIGRRLKDIMTQAYVNMALSSSASTNLPCIGLTGHREIAGVLWNMCFNATNADFGPGRAGENLISLVNSTVVVNVNAASLKGYDTLSGGLAYLVAHEVAHALSSMQAYDKLMWENYIAGPGAGLPPAQQRAEYPNSVQFSQNEARTNSVANALAAKWLLPPLSVDPLHGYQPCSLI